MLLYDIILLYKTLCYYLRLYKTSISSPEIIPPVRYVILFLKFLRPLSSASFFIQIPTDWLFIVLSLFAIISRTFHLTDQFYALPPCKEIDINDN